MSIEINDYGKYVRFCDVCQTQIFEGYYINGEEHYCSDECLHKVYTEEEYNEMYENDYGYWTDWEEDY